MDRISGRKIIIMIAPPKPVTAWTKPPRRAEKATTNIPIIKASFPDSVQQKELKRTVSATALPGLHELINIIYINSNNDCHQKQEQLVHYLLINPFIDYPAAHSA